MKLSISKKKKKNIFIPLSEANSAFNEIYIGDNSNRQPLHTVYGGAHLFKYNTALTLGKIAEKTFEIYAPNFVTYAHAFGLQGADKLPKSQVKIKAFLKEFETLKTDQRKRSPGYLAYQVYEKVKDKLAREAVEDFRIDFEDGFGNRPNEEEDKTAVQAAQEVARGMKEGTLPPFIGIRIKPFTEELKERSVRTLDLFLTTLTKATKRKLPKNFFIMLPKVTIPEQPEALARLFRVLEKALKLPKGILKMEMMVETTQSIMDAEGKNPLRKFIKAAKGRCVAMHFGTYDYTASCGITAKYQTMDHPVCDFAHHVTKVALGHTGIWLSDGATNIMPVGPNREETLSRTQIRQNFNIVHAAWREGYRHIRHSLWNGFYQGWDLHPAQFPMRYTAVYAFFLESYAQAVERLKAFMDKAAQATLIGDTFDDAATGQGLLNYFLRALNSGAINEEEVLAAGLTLEEIRTRSFAKILKMRRKQQLNG